jgi:hypothetical protein
MMLDVCQHSGIEEVHDARQGPLAAVKMLLLSSSIATDMSDFSICSIGARWKDNQTIQQGGERPKAKTNKDYQTIRLQANTEPQMLVEDN